MDAACDGCCFISLILLVCRSRDEALDGYRSVSEFSICHVNPALNMLPLIKESPGAEVKGQHEICLPHCGSERAETSADHRSDDCSRNTLQYSVRAVI